jgi:hypothetical protein
MLERGLLANLSSHETITLIRIANGDVLDGNDLRDANVTRLRSLGLVEQLGISFQLTEVGIQRVTRLRRSS